VAKPKINADLCTGCALCLEDCEGNGLEMVDDVAQLVRPEDCTGCGNCADNCPSDAIVMS
jgi:NAD-dependent dihydropyrimidine dehydrogenase PreA subunit